MSQAIADLSGGVPLPGVAPPGTILLETQVRYLTAPEAKTTSHTIRLFAKAFKQDPNGEFIGDGEYEFLDVCLPNNGSSCTPRIKTLIAAALGDEWQLVNWWMPEPDDCDEF